MVPGWSEREWHALNALRDEWIGSGKRNRHVHSAVARPRVRNALRVFVISVIGAARRLSIAQRPAISEVIRSATARGRWPRVTDRTMQGGTR